MPNVIQLADQLKRELQRRDAAAMARVSAAYRVMYGRLEAERLALIESMKDGMTAADVRKLRAYRLLLDEVEKEMTTYAGWLAVEVGTVGGQAAAYGVRDAEALVRASGIVTDFRTLNPAVIEKMLAFLDKDGPLYQRITALPGWTKEQIANLILDGVAKGYNPRKIAAQIQKGLGGGLTEALRMTRTAQIYAYREANRASYLANADIVKKWVWYADLTQACASCVAMHGTEHDLDEVLDDHHNGHCSMIPLVIGAENEVERGADWFEKQPEAKQRELLGKGRYEAWKAGKFDLSQLPVTHDDPVYGSMRTAAPLKDLVAED